MCSSVIFEAWEQARRVVGRLWRYAWVSPKPGSGVLLQENNSFGEDSAVDDIRVWHLMRG